MGGNELGKRVAENRDDEKRQIPRRQGAVQPSETSPANVLTKIEQTQQAECQISEYLTLLSSFPDVKKSD
jgi:hypothetical protein